MSKKVDVKLQLQRLNVASVVLFVLAAVLTGFLVGGKTYPLTLPHLTQDSLASKGQALIVPASKILFDISIKWVLVVTFVLAAIVPLLSVSRWQKDYQKAIRAKVNLWRWIDSAVVGSMLYVIVGMLYGWHDLVALKVTAVLSAVGFLLMWATERQTAKDKKPAWLLYVLGAVCLLVPLAWLAVSGVGTMVYGLIRASWYVYVSFGILVLAVLATAANYKMNLSGKKDWKDYLVIERNYALINLVSRLALAVVLIIGISR